MVRYGRLCVWRITGASFHSRSGVKSRFKRSSRYKLQTTCRFSEEDELSYEAVSYHWGPKNVECRKIVCDGCVLRISGNLWDGLQRLRKTRRSRFLWIDAISINQSNIAERGHQVTLMRQIYKKAERVLIWAGEESIYHAEAALSLICRISNAFPADKRQGQIALCWTTSVLKSTGAGWVWPPPGFVLMTAKQREGVACPACSTRISCIKFRWKQRQLKRLPRSYGGWK